MIDTQQQYINLNIRGEISIIVVQVHSGRKRDIYVVCLMSVYVCMYMYCSCNNVAPVTNLCLGRATTRSHSSQWSKTKVPVET